MTIQELSRYYEIQTTLEKDREVYNNLLQRAGPASPKLTGMPHVSGVQDKVGDLAIELADMEDRIQCLEEQAQVERLKVEAYCRTIADARMYLIFRLRFVRCLTWAEIADKLGRYYTEAGVSRMVYSYLSTH